MAVIHPRSSKFSSGVNTSGVVDSDYRGIVHVMLQNTSNQLVQVTKGERVAQICLIECNLISWDEVEDVKEFG